MRFLAAVILNVVMPGAGLIVLGRPRTGLISAVLFTVSAETAVAGALLAPAMIPPWLLIGSGVMAGATWLMAQWMLRDRISTLRDPALQHELDLLRQQATEAIERSELQDARGILHIARNIDPDSVDTMVLWARLTTALGRFRDSRRTWEHVARSGDPRFRREAINALEKLPK